MNIICTADYDQMSRRAANIISAQIILKPDSVLGLATGASPLGIYKQLIDWKRKGDLSFARVRTVNLDEYVGLGPGDHQSYAFFMYENLFKHININSSATYLPDGTNLDAAEECSRYNRVIKSLGGIDMQLLGIGSNGHIGFNEPGGAFEKETHCVKLTAQTINDNRRFFEKGQDVPTHAYTMGIKSIMSARKIVLVATGENKREAVYQMAAGEIKPEVPASILQLHNDVTVVADADALGLVLEKAPELVDEKL